MDVYSALSNLAVLISALLGIAVSFWPLSTNKKKGLFMAVFLVLGILAILFQSLKAKNDKIESDAMVAANGKAQAELLLWQSGDPEKPPYVGFTTSTKSDGTFVIRFNMHNPSNYPVYDVNLRVWDNDKMIYESSSLDDIVRQSMVNVKILSINPQSVQILDSSVEVSPTELSKSFGAQFSSRTGGYSQSIAARKVNTKGWVFASRLVSFGTGPEKIIFKNVDEGFPLNSAGDVDW